MLRLMGALRENFICSTQMKKPLIYGNLKIDYHEERFFLRLSFAIVNYRKLTKKERPVRQEAHGV